MFEYIVQIGPVGIPIFLSSLIGMAIFIERLYRLRKDKIIPKHIVEKIERNIESSQVDALFDIFSEDRSVLGEMLSVMRRQLQLESNREQISARLEEWAAQEAARFERGLPALSTIASIAPLLGLLGTVLGMVLTFDAIQQYGLGNIDGLAGGISQALLTTLAGLSVGIPALIGYRYLQHLVDSLLLELEHIAVLLLDALERK